MTFDAQTLIKETIKRYGQDCAVACSFGKDSMVVLDMALKVNKDIKVLFHNTGVEFPETIEYARSITKLWNLNLIETKPYKNKTFWDCAKQYGLPSIRKSGGKGANSPKCCYYLKERPAQIKIKELGLRAIMTGLLKCESRNRSMLMSRMDNSEQIDTCGQRYYSKSWGLFKIHPIAYWSEKQVWDYINENDLPINPVYTKWGGIYPRCGCLPCTAYKSWEKRLAKSHHKLYLQLKKIEHPYQEVLK